MVSGLPNPYKLKETSTGYSFKTDNQIIYEIKFIVFEGLKIRSSKTINYYEFAFFPKKNANNSIQKVKFDERVEHTICQALIKFFLNPNNVLYFVHSTEKGREKQRKRLFEKWFSKYSNLKLVKIDSSVLHFHNSIIYNPNHPDSDLIVKAFNRYNGKFDT